MTSRADLAQLETELDQLVAPIRDAFLRQPRASVTLLMYLSTAAKCPEMLRQASDVRLAAVIGLAQVGLIGQMVAAGRVVVEESEANG